MEDRNLLTKMIIRNKKKGTEKKIKKFMAIRRVVLP
jgi:hypothetical protein